MNLGLAEDNRPASAFAEALAARAQAEGLWRTRQLTKGECLFEQGIRLDCAFVLQDGLVKLVYLTPDGDEWIKSLIADRGVFGPSSSEPGTPVAYSGWAIEPSCIAAVPLDWIGQALADSSELAAAYTRFLDWVRSRKEAREAALLCQNAETRYRDMLAQSPDLLARLPQSDIARYLRVTPIAFSRIKRRLRGARAER